MREAATPDATITGAYLARLGMEAEPPSSAALARLHRAHVERIPWETLWIHLEEQWAIDPTVSMTRIGALGRAGYCFHHNGAFGTLLGSLGYAVEFHIGGVHGPAGPTEEDMTNHLVLTVHGLPTDTNPDGVWYVDTGLGDVLYEPIPLRPGTYAQGPFRFGLADTPGPIGDWELTNDPSGSFSGMAWRSETAGMHDFEARHQFLSTSPDSGFARVLTVQRRDATGADTLRGRTLRRTGVNARDTLLDSRQDLVDALFDVFGIDLSNVDSARLDELWPRTLRAHEEWLASLESALPPTS
jgi:arylamine N-acetyltransferase